jgi:hypothetical protein
MRFILRHVCDILPDRWKLGTRGLWEHIGLEYEASESEASEDELQTRGTSASLITERRWKIEGPNSKLHFRGQMSDSEKARYALKDSTREERKYSFAVPPSKTSKNSEGAKNVVESQGAMRIINREKYSESEVAKKANRGLEIPAPHSVTPLSPLSYGYGSNLYLPAQSSSLMSQSKSEANGTKRKRDESLASPDGHRNIKPPSTPFRSILEKETTKMYMKPTISQDLSGTAEQNCRSLLICLQDRPKGLRIRSSQLFSRDEKRRRVG